MLKIKNVLGLVLMLSGFNFLNADRPGFYKDGEPGSPVFIFAHGWGSTSDYVMSYLDYGVIPDFCHVMAPNGPEVDENGKINKMESSLAQDADINIIVDTIDSAVKKYGEDCKIVLIGVSKGAATMINTVGWLAKNKSEYLKNIKSVVLESPFADVQDVFYEKFLPKPIKNIFGKGLSMSLMRPIVHQVMPNYNFTGIKPIESVKNDWIGVNKDISVVLIHSKGDRLINIHHAYDLCEEFKKLNLKNFDFIELADGIHANVFWGCCGAEALSQLWDIYTRLDIAPNLKVKQDQSENLA